MGKIVKEKQLDWAIKVLAIILSAFALFISLQANKIAKEANTPKVSILDIEFWKGNSVKGVNGGYINCDHRIRITNIGGAADSIIGFGVQLSFLNSNLKAQGTSTVIHANQGFSQDHAELKSYLYTLEGVTGDPQMIFVIPGEEREITLPYKIEAGETIDIYSSTSLDFDPSIGIFISPDKGQGPLFEDPSGIDQLMVTIKKANINAEFIPMFIDYGLNLSSGRHVQTPSTTCTYAEYIKN